LINLQFQYFAYFRLQKFVTISYAAHRLTIKTIFLDSIEKLFESYLSMTLHKYLVDFFVKITNHAFKVAQYFFINIRLH